jgi:cell division protease FtsH
MAPLKPEIRQKSDGQHGPGKPQPSPRGALIWWLVMFGLLAWNVVTFWPKTNPEVTLPYTTFLDQVRSDNVAKVQVTGDQITGTFIKAFRFPEASAIPPAHSPESGESKPPVTGSPGITKPQTPGVASSESQKAPSPSATETRAPVKVSPGTAKKEPAADYKAFQVIFPENIGDPRLLPLLESHKVAVEVEPPPSHWFALLLTYGFPILLLVGLFVWMGRQGSRAQGGILGFARSKARRYTSDRPQVTFADVAGAEEAKADLQEEVDFLKSPAKYHQLGARIPRGVLLVGQPGTGKTLLARAVAGEAGVPFFSISASEFVEMFVGVGAGRVRSLFQEAKAAAPAIVFIDELDAVGRRRGAGLGQTNDEREQTLNQLLVEMDGFDERHEVIVLAATNRPDVLDPALLRPGRFDREVMVGLPDRIAREGIMRIHTRNLAVAHDVDISVLARSTTGMSGADLANLCNEAALIAARVGHKEVSMGDFEEAIDKVVLGAARPPLRDPNDRRVVAYHEAGHAVVAWYTPEADPVHKLTIIPHGRALGVTEQLPGDDRYNYSRTYLLARLSVMLGGRTSEEIVIGDVTTGAENDLVEATRMARRMVARWGMGDLGLVAFKADEVQPFLGYELSQGRDYSEATAAGIDKEVRQLLAGRHEVVTALLKGRRAQLDLLAEALLQSESVGQEELVKLLGPRPGRSSSAASNP